MELTKGQENAVKFLVSGFNSKVGGFQRFGSEKNQKAAIELLNASDGDIGVARRKLNAQADAGCRDFVTACYQAIGKDEAPAPAPAPEVKEESPAPAAVPAASPAQDALSLIQNVVVEILARTKLEDIKAEAGKTLREETMQFIRDTYGPITRKVVYELPERKVELDGIVHEKFETVLKFVQANEPVFLTGPAGSGKNVICQQVAKAMGLNFYFSNAVTQEYKITGFTDAMGTFHESQFYKAFKNGGVFMLDEMDASIPEVLIILNAAIANRYFDFPAPIGYVEAHPDFRVIAAGNTFGYGADYDYVGRNQLDAASLDRFAMVRIDYSEAIEAGMANGDDELLRFCRAFRRATKSAGIRAVVSYRAISRMAKLSGCMSTEDLLDTCLLKSLGVDDLNAIKSGVSGCGKYSAAFQTVLNARKEG